MFKSISIINLTLLWFAMTIHLSAQTAYEWDYHGIGFEVASDFGVTVNNASQFSAISSDGLLSVTLVPWSDNRITLDNLAEATVQSALELAVFDQATVSGDALDLGDLQGYFIVAATDDYGSYDFLLMALLLDSESETNLSVAIGYMDGHVDEAIEILTSIYPYDP